MCTRAANGTIALRVPARCDQGGTSPLPAPASPRAPARAPGDVPGEYRINLSREIGHDPDRPNVSRRRMVAFGDAIPSLRIAVDLRVELFRNLAKPWSMNAIHDIDALS